MALLVPERGKQLLVVPSQQIALRACEKEMVSESGDL